MNTSVFAEGRKSVESDWLLVSAEPTFEQGFAEVEKRMVDLHEPIKALGVYKVPVRLHADVKPEIKVWVIKA